MKKLKEYALYKGEECLGIGTMKELAKQFNIKVETMKFYHTPANHKRERKGNRKILICLDD